MISFQDLKLIAVIGGKHYRVVIDGDFESSSSCFNCALYGLSLCKEYKCSCVKHNLQYHYEEIRE